MPTVTNAKLTLTKSGANVDIEVRYDVHFSQLESNLAGLGMIFTDFVQIFGVDASKVQTETTLQAIFEVIPVTPKSRKVPRVHKVTVPRIQLDEDPDIIFLDEDELIGRIRVRGHGLLTTPADAFTNEVVLSPVGGILNND